MIGIQALETNKPVVSEFTTKERRPLKDIDVNRSHQLNIPSKDGRNIGKATISSGFRVFADGETNVKIPVKVSADGEKQVFGAKKPFQTINGTCSKKLITKDTGPISVEQVDVGFRANCGVFKDNSLSDHTISATSAKVANMNWLEKQLAMLQVKETSSKPQILVTNSCGVGVKNTVSTVIPNINEIDNLARSAKQYEDNVCAGKAKEPEPSTNDTGAIRKVVSDTANSTKFNNTSQLPIFKWNVMAEEWNTTKEKLYDHGNSKDSFSSNVGVQQISTPWNFDAFNVETNLPNQYTDATGINRNFPSTTQSIGRKIVGKKCTPFERGHQVAANDILRELDDRTEEIQLYERYKEARRKKAIEAMRVEQERKKRKIELRPNVPTNMKNPQQSTVIRGRNYPTERFGIDGFQRPTNTSYNPGPTLPLPAIAPGVKPSVCIIKYSIPPNEPIRYEPIDLLRMNTSNKNADKRYGSAWTCHIGMTHFSSD
ncbi:uncharacterized protein LOC128716266 [Anopheles marshallii]|uniref:uncharacterized protein LOC128716266 n=1 Tax=Anopheles marshallii TaxID=1521116 RepID=UPI00237C4135|nr:uncharacterized protein LOC128716266 [Anopheles marshallii]